MQRGDLVLCVMAREHGKPRPALVVQGDAMARSGCGSVLLCPTSSDVSGILGWRVAVHPTPVNGRHLPSEIMVDKLTAVPLGRVRDVIGRLDDTAMREVDWALLLVLGFS
jgi:mRNA interferase MazF